MLSVQNNFLQIIVQSHESVSKLAAYKTINERTGYNVILDYIMLLTESTTCLDVANHNETIELS